MDAGGFADGTHGGAGNNTRTGGGRQQNHVGGAVAAFHNVRDRLAVERHGDHAPHAFLASFFDARRNFVRLAVAPADFAFTVADDDHRGEAKATTTLHDGGAPLDL